MGYIEELAAKEANRQETNRARAVQAAQVMNSNSGLADVARVQQGYQPNGLSDRDAMVVAQQNAIAQRAYEQAAAKQYAQSQEYANTLKDAGQASWDGRTGVVVPQGSIDQGLAAKYAADRAAFR